MTHSEHYATLPRRLMAILYDSILIFALMCLVTLPFIAVRGGAEVEPSTRLYQLTMLAIPWLFCAGYWSYSGRTLGMQSWGLQLENRDGKTPNFLVASWRFFAAVISLLPLGLGYFWQLWDKDGLSWHDRLSGTRVRFYAPS